MNRFVIIIMGFILLGTVGCSDNPGEKTGKKEARIAFEKINHDYGTIPFGSEGICEFGFTNTGKSPLVLTNVKSSCGCTIPEWPREPIKRNESGTIRVRYDTHRVGIFNKAITVYSNADNSPKRLFIKGRVEPAEKEK